MKLSRIKNSSELKRNDIADLVGYLMLLMKNNGWDNFYGTWWISGYKDVKVNDFRRK